MLVLRSLIVQNACVILYKILPRPVVTCGNETRTLGVDSRLVIDVAEVRI